MEDADRTRTCRHDDVLEPAVLDSVLETTPVRENDVGLFVDLRVELSEDRGRCRALLLENLHERGGHLAAPLTAGRREARGHDVESSRQDVGRYGPRSGRWSPP